MCTAERKGAQQQKSCSNDQEKDVARMQRMDSDRCRPKLVFSTSLAANWRRYRKLLWRIQGPGVLQLEGCDGDGRGASQSHENPIV